MPKLVHSSRFSVHGLIKTVNCQLLTVNRKSAGFSLIEVLLSIFLITTLVTILLTSSGTLFTTYNSRLQSQASKIASKKIENLRNTAFSLLPSGGTNTSCTNDADLTADLAKLKNASCSLTITNYDTPIEANTKIKWATVTIKWDNDRKVQQNLNIDTLVYKEGL